MIQNNISIKNSFFFYNLPLFFTVLIPILLITGPFLPDLALSLTAIIMLINILKNKNYFYLKNKFCYIFFIFYLFCLASSFNSNDVLFSLKSSFFYIRFFFFALSTWFLLTVNSKIINYIFISIFISFCLLIFDGFYQFIFGKNILGWPLIKTRVSSFFADELILGSYLSRLFPILFACMIFRYEYFKKKDYLFHSVFLIFVLSEVLMFLSGERTAFFFMNLSAIFIIILSKKYSKLRLHTFVLSIILIVAISNFVPQFKERIFDKTLEQIGFNNEKKYVFTQQHTDHYKSAYKMIQENVFFGVGAKMFRVECSNPKYIISKYSCSTHPHNTYLQIFAETGIVNFLILFSIFLFILYKSLYHLYLKVFKKNFLYNDFQVALLSSILITFWPLAPSGNFFNNWISIVYFYPFGIFLWSLSNNLNLKIDPHNNY